MLLSSIFVQAISHSNTPEHFEAIAHTYSLVMLFSRTKVYNQLNLQFKYQFRLGKRVVQFSPVSVWSLLCRNPAMSL